MKTISVQDIESAKQKDENAYRRINEYIQIEARRISPKDLDYAHELAQRTLVKLLDGSINTYKAEKRSPDKWLTNVLFSIYKDSKRAKRRKREISINATIPGQDRTYDTILEAIDKRYKSGALTEEEASKFRTELKEILSDKSEETRQTVNLQYMRNMNQEGISATEDIPLGTVKSRVGSAIATLRQKRSKLEKFLAP